MNIAFTTARTRIAVITAVTMTAIPAARTCAQDARQTDEPAPTTRPTPAAPDEVVVHWLDGQAQSPFMGTTWGVPWPMGEVSAGMDFIVSVPNGDTVPSQSWPLAYWPDGSLKWSAHAIAPVAQPARTFSVRPQSQAPSSSNAPLAVENADAITIDTGLLRCIVPRQGAVLIASAERDGRTTLRNGRLVCLRQNQPSDPDELSAPTAVETFTSQIDRVTLEQAGPIRAVIKIEGRHADQNRSWLPFIIRLYFYKGSGHIRVMHTFIFDGDESRDFIRGLGLRFDVPMSDPFYDRHMRFVSAEGGLWAEAVQTVTGLRRDPGRRVRDLQVAGKPLPDPSTWDEGVGEKMRWVPTWGDVTLSQLSADGFEIRKRTQPGCGWIFSDGARRAAGVGYLGGPSGGVAFGIRNFWQSCPAQLDIRNAASESTTVTMWLWSPQAPAMDLRFYHDGLGIEGHQQELDALRITYEDYEPGFGTPMGVARTSEMHLWITGETPPNQAVIDFARDVSTPPLLACTPEHFVHCNIFGGLFDLPDRSTPRKAAIEDNLNHAFQSYLTQREQRRWYGFWNYGDIMHSYDASRHVWRYDVGGYAWDNSELSPDLWLWYSYLRTGRADIFRFAEAQCRHSGEVDVHHLGPFQDLGSRHNVMHWGCSAKQLRISQVAYRRFYYYLTADERTGDLMDEQVDNVRTFLKLDPLRKIRNNDYTPRPDAIAVGLGTDWGAIAMANLTAWERTGDEAFRRRLVNSLESIGSMKYGFFTINARINPDNLRFVEWPDAYDVDHLAAVFGLNEVCAELVQLLDVPDFERAWLDYCQYYNAPREERAKALGIDHPSGILVNGHSRMTAFAAVHRHDDRLARRAWREFFAADSEQFLPDRFNLVNRRIDAGPESLKTVNETNWMSTNDIGMWGTAAIQNLALIGDKLPAAEQPDED